MKKIICVIIAALLLSACTTTTMHGGSGQLFQLSDRHVVYRDLTVPVGLGNEPERQSVNVPGIQP
ncbi:membrane lipoprotein lipid attachment site-containing protein [Enterobacter sp. CM29]|uniref:membrane lipoprotein lipid attachment site-containing protein n=1 Tax=Enterobacter sp. CM29 TaxID=2738449 RepID=UPI001559356E|nr:membrane lipoprotein lipid attachment site-containing protein [Enterobacter sp. CM29]NQD64130.1 membrane lipoprotein lipid attachment site-containing protein [Enterobacter sp. CM29]